MLRGNPWRTRWAETPFPDPPRHQLQEIAEKHGFSTLNITRLPSTGVVNSIFALGDEAVLRIPKPVPDMIEDTYTESVAAPAAYGAGVRTPQLLVFDDDRDVVPDAPFTIYERVVGSPLSDLELLDDDEPALYRAVGREIAGLHRNVTVVEDPAGRLDQPGRWTTPAFTDPLTLDGFISDASAREVARLFERLRGAVEGVEYRRFVHQDIKPSNLMGSGRKFEAIIDWGDAGWGDPVFDFRYLPFRAAHYALEGYRSEMPIDGDSTAEARIIWDQIWSAVSSLNYLPNGARRGSDRDRPGSRAVDLIAFLLSDEGRSWRDAV